MGETGKGFVVVASKVKALSNQTGRATGEISRSVQQAAAGTGAVLHNINDVRDAAQTVGGRADEVLSASENLAVEFRSLESEVDAFLARVCA